jgi:hypothetical protein
MHAAQRPPAGADEGVQRESGIGNENLEDGLDGASPEKEAGPEPRSRKHVDLIISNVLRNADFFHTPDGEPFATVHSEERYQTWPVRSKDFRLWIQWLFYQDGRRYAQVSGCPGRPTPL